MSEPQLKCKIMSHNYDNIIAVCVNSDCNQPRLCCFICMQDGKHQKHGKEVLQFQGFDLWKQDGFRIIDLIKLVINEQDNLIQLLSQLIIENQKAVDINIGYATATQIEQSIDQINKLKKIDQLVKRDLDQLSQQIKKKLKKLKSQRGSYFTGQPMQQQPIQIQEQVTEQFKIMPAAIQKTQFRFSQMEKCENIRVSDEGRVAQNGQNVSMFSSLEICLCEPMLPRNIETQFAIKYISGKVCIGVYKRDQIRKLIYQPNLYIIGHGSYLIDNDGYTYSHHQKEMNMKSYSFNIYKNDIIVVQFDKSMQMIIWINQSTNQTFSMELGKQESNYYPCVYLLRGEAQIIHNY